MLQHDSPLRRLPKDLDPKQAFYFDGMRHSAEVAFLAWSRLRETLAVLADDGRRSTPSQGSHAAAFLDAWCVVDAVDRFRVLWRKAPGGPLEVGDKTFWELTEDLRKVRNVSDHLIGAEQQILAANTGALGTLHWLTLDRFEPPAGAACVLRPGFLPKVHVDFGDLSELTFSPDSRVNAVRLQAGNHTANLSSAMAHLEARVAHLEAALAAQLGADATTELAASDLLACADFSVPKLL